MSPEAYDIVERLVKYTYFKSMNELRARVKSELTSRGLKEELKKFKLKAAGDQVAIYIKRDPRQTEELDPRNRS